AVLAGTARAGVEGAGGRRAVMRLFRRSTLAEVDRPPLARDERVLAWADSDMGVLVATNLGLWLPADPPGRLGWRRIHKATWDGKEVVVTSARQVEERSGYVVVEDLPPVPFALSRPGELPHQVRARVTRSVGQSTHHPLPGSGGVRIAARRVPGRDGLRWTVRYDSGVDHDDPVVAEVTGQLVSQARPQLGSRVSYPPLT